MKYKLILTALLMAATAIPAYAADAAPAGPAKSFVCLERQDLDGWGTRDDHSIVVNDRFGRKYLLSLSGLCSDLNFAFGISVRGFGGPNMCMDTGDRIVSHGGGTIFPHDTCWITKVQYYTPEMAAADKAARAEHKPLAVY